MQEIAEAEVLFSDNIGPGEDAPQEVLDAIKGDK